MRSYIFLSSSHFFPYTSLFGCRQNNRLFLLFGQGAFRILLGPSSKHIKIINVVIKYIEHDLLTINNYCV
jgi:hypothetical protein